MVFNNSDKTSSGSILTVLTAVWTSSIYPPTRDLSTRADRDWNMVLGIHSGIVFIADGVAEHLENFLRATTSSHGPLHSLVAIFHFAIVLRFQRWCCVAWAYLWYGSLIHCCSIIISFHGDTMKWRGRKKSSRYPFLAKKIFSHCICIFIQSHFF